MDRSHPARVVVIGGGFAGASTARALERLNPPVQVTVVDKRNYSVFYPLLIEAGTGSLEPRHVVIPIRSFLTRGRFHMGEVTAVDLERRQVRTRSEATGEEGGIEYDHLILAPGSVSDRPGGEGLSSRVFQMKDLSDAVVLRDRAVAMLEAAQLEPDERKRRELLHFVVVGGNFTGVEVAGELDMFFRRARPLYDRIGAAEFKVTLVERERRILPALSPFLAGYARDNLERRGVDVILNDSVESADGSSVHLDSSPPLASSTVIWCAGIAPSPLIKALDLPTDKRGYLLCDPDCRVQGQANVWALGDAAVNVDASGSAHPPTAQHAVRQGRHVAANIGRVLSGRPSCPLESGSTGSLAALGCRAGVAEILGIRISGFAAWWLYRTVYLMKMPGLVRKLRVALDWTLDLIFPPDPVQLGLYRQAGPPHTEAREKARHEAHSARGSGGRSRTPPGGARQDHRPLRDGEPVRAGEAHP